MSPEEESIRQVHATWIRAVNAGDVSRLLLLMTDDVVFLNPGQAPVGRWLLARDAHTLTPVERKA